MLLYIDDITAAMAIRLFVVDAAAKASRKPKYLNEIKWNSGNIIVKTNLEAKTNMNRYHTVKYASYQELSGFEI